MNVGIFQFISFFQTKMMKLLLPFLIFGTIYAKERKGTLTKFKEIAKKELPLPHFLCNNSQTPSDYMEMTPDKESNIKLGIQIDNYSGYTLKNPFFHPYYGSKAIAISNATKLGEVLPYRTDFIILKNSEKYYVRGSISWEIFLGEEHTKQRMVVTFKIPYKWVQNTFILQSPFLMKFTS